VEDDEEEEEEEEEEEDDIPWDELARDDEGSSSQPSMSAQVSPKPYACLDAAGGGCAHRGGGCGSRHPAGGSRAGGERQRAEEAELGSGGPTRKRPRMVASR
jgi:hypothetical protein